MTAPIARTGLWIAADLVLPLNAATQKIAFLGRTGTGKTYAAQKLAEEMGAAGIQFVSLDPVGVWYGLRIAGNGKSPGIQIPVFGGLHGDLPLEPTGGALIADIVCERGISAIIDVSQFESDSQKARFSGDFAARFFFLKKAKPSPVMLFLEECQEFIPQNPEKNETMMLHAFTRLGKIGRNFGIGLTLISQRPQDINKKVLNMTECMFAFQMTGPHERKAIREWVHEKGAESDIADVLPKLETGQPHVWSPQWLNISRVVRIGKKWTFNASSTPEAGASKAADPRPLDKGDIESLGAAMSETIERAKAHDPELLRRRVAELERQLAKKEVPPAAAGKRVEVPVLKDGQLKRLETLVSRVQAQEELQIASSNKRAISVASALREISAILEPLSSPRATLGYVPAQPGRLTAAPAAAARKPSAGAISSEKLPPGELAILKVAAQYSDGATREQMTVLTGYKRSSRDAYIQRLSQRGFVQLSGANIIATLEGIDALGPDFEPLPSGVALQKYWAERLPEGEHRILEILIAASGAPIDRDALGESTGYKRSSRDAYIQRLRSRKLVDVTSAGVRANGMLLE